MCSRECLGCAALINVLVEPGSNSTFTSALAFFRPMVSTTMIVMGVRLRLRDILLVCWYLPVVISTFCCLGRRLIYIFRCLGRRLISSVLYAETVLTLCLFHLFSIADLVKKSLPKMTSYLVQNR